jgi:hypothetical protein
MTTEATETTTEETKPKRTRKRPAAHVDPDKGAEWEAAQVEADKAASEAVADARQEAMPPRRFEGLLPCKLTTEEKAERGHQLSAALGRVDAIAAKRKIANDGFKAETEIEMVTVRAMQKAIDSDEEDRSVEQIERFDLRRCTAQTLRVDTGEVVSERALTSSELQPSLPLTEDGSQMNLGDVEPGDIGDPDALLRAAQAGEDDPADGSLDNDGSSEDLGDDEDDES